MFATKLGIKKLFDEIDKNKDENVSEDELED